MGASNFGTRAIKAKTAREAYRIAVDEARDENGSRDGYSGDIQTTNGFVIVTPKGGEAIDALVDRLMDDPGSTKIEKWGKAGAVETAPGQWMFFGWGAS
jgi:hypothetical protein